MKKDVYSVSKLALHEDKIRALSEGKITAPIYARVKPTNICNHFCFFCGCNPKLDYFRNKGINKYDEIPYEIMMNILSDFKDMGVKAVTYSGGGEPCLYPHIKEVLKKTSDYGIEFSMITNGQKLDGEIAGLLSQAEWVRVSIDSCEAETLSKSRGISEKAFNKIIDNIKEFSTIKKEQCILGINFPVHKLNKNQVYTAAKFFKDLGADNIKFTPTWTPDFFDYHKDFKDEVIRQIARAAEEFNDNNFEVYETYENDFKLSSDNKRTYSKCCIMQIVPCIGADCFVYPCQDKAYSEKNRIGSLKEKSFKELWFSEETAKIFKEFNPQKECNHHCTYDSRNISALEMLNNQNDLHKYKPTSEKHKNFI